MGGCFATLGKLVALIIGAVLVLSIIGDGESHRSGTSPGAGRASDPQVSMGEPAFLVGIRGPKTWDFHFMIDTSSPGLSAPVRVEFTIKGLTYAGEEVWSDRFSAEIASQKWALRADARIDADDACRIHHAKAIVHDVTPAR